MGLGGLNATVFPCVCVCVCVVCGVCFVCVVWVMWRFRTRLRGDLDIARPETLARSWEVGAVLYGLPAPPGTPGGQGSIGERRSVRGGEGGAQELRSVAEQMHCVLLHPLRLPLPAPPASYRLPQKELVARLPDGAAMHWRRGGDRWRRRRAPVRKPRATPPALPVPLRLDRSLAVLGAVAIRCRRPAPSAASHRGQPACLKRKSMIFETRGAKFRHGHFPSHRLLCN